MVILIKKFVSSTGIHEYMSDAQKLRDELAKELRTIYWHKGKTMCLESSIWHDVAKHVQRLVLEARIKEHKKACEYASRFDTCANLENLKAELKELGEKEL